MSELSRTLNSAVNRMASRFGGSTFVVAAIDKTLDDEQRRIVLDYLIDLGVTHPAVTRTNSEGDPYYPSHLTGVLDALVRYNDYPKLDVAKAAAEQLGASDRRLLLSHLLGDGVTLPQGPKANEEAPGPVQPHTGLPQKLRGAIHELTRKYAINLIVDAAMLELPEKERAEVAKAFLPKKPLREKLDEQRAQKEAEQARLYVLVDAASGEELGKIDPEALAQHIRIVDGKTGEPRDYLQVRITPEYDFREADDAAPRMLALYRPVGGPTE